MKKYILLLALSTACWPCVCIGQSPAANTDESKVPPYHLPDPLLMRNGKKVTSRNEWESVQRPYIYHLFEENVFGKYPQKKISARYRLRETDPQAFQGLATRKQVRIYLHPADTTVFMDLLLYIPNRGQKPAPVFMGLNFSGNHTVADDAAILLPESWLAANARGVVNHHATESSRAIDTAAWQVKNLLGRGYGLATVYYGDIEPDHPDGWKTGIRTTLQQVLDIRPQEWGAIGAWAWGLARVMDYLGHDRDVNPHRVALMGHSRLGKAALWAGASDRRYALVISNESGEGGAALSKRWYGETVKLINDRFPHWFNKKYKTYNDHPEALPVDGHMLLSLMAPRPLYVASAEGDQWSDPKGEFLAARHADPVYALFGKKGIGQDSMPPLHQPLGHTVQYHIRAGRHAVTWYDWQQYLRFADEQLGK